MAWKAGTAARAKAYLRGNIKGLGRGGGPGRKIEEEIYAEGAAVAASVRGRRTMAEEAAEKDRKAGVDAPGSYGKFVDESLAGQAWKRLWGRK